MTQFSFGTKAQNLWKLKQKAQRSTVLDLMYFTVEEWEYRKSDILEQIIRLFPNTLLAVRSSKVGEDSIENSMAGKFESVLRVPSVEQEIVHAVETVFNSYGKSCCNIHDEILIQPMLTDISCSGVLFTRVLETYAPYYVINYDDITLSTDSVTSGIGSQLKQILVHRDTGDFGEWWHTLLESIRELEAICGSDSLDVEFGITNNGEVVIFQVRPLVQKVIRHQQHMDQQTRRQLANIEQFTEDKLVRKPGLYGERTILGQMPDWNPAEIIGTRPKPLAYSLYRFLVMDSAWRVGRKGLGYKSPNPYSLMLQIADRPYVDVRASFNSLLPEGLCPHTSEKLINYYINKLADHPHLHDKIEFEIVFSCLDFTSNKMKETLRHNDFNESEINEIYSCLFQLTIRVVCEQESIIQAVNEALEQLREKRAKWQTSVDSPGAYLTAVNALLKDCIEYGTIPFSSIARCAFIGTQLIRSLAEVGIITEELLGLFFNSIETVSSQYTKDLNDYMNGIKSLDYMYKEYGHLRPGTYDITASRYDERPELYFVGSINADEEVKRDSFSFTKHQLDSIQVEIEAVGYHFDARQLIRFIVESIALREKVKFEFTKNISLALKYISEFGYYYGFSPDDMAYFQIDQLLLWEQQNVKDDFVQRCRALIDEQRFTYTSNSHIALPDLIVSTKDINVIKSIQSSPNFTTNARVVAEAVYMSNGYKMEENLNLEGKIVLIEQADPGYDWLFTRNIAGLITKYGGVASHMAIRCAEFGIPAAIGCGQWLFSQLQQSRYIDLNCQERRVRSCEGFL